MNRIAAEAIWRQEVAIPKAEKSKPEDKE